MEESLLASKRSIMSSTFHFPGDTDHSQSSGLELAAWPEFVMAKNGEKKAHPAKIKYRNSDKKGEQSPKQQGKPNLFGLRSTVPCQKWPMKVHWSSRCYNACKIDLCLGIASRFLERTTSCSPSAGYVRASSSKETVRRECFASVRRRSRRPFLLCLILAN